MLLVFFKHKTAYEMRISDWSSDVCSSDLIRRDHLAAERREIERQAAGHGERRPRHVADHHLDCCRAQLAEDIAAGDPFPKAGPAQRWAADPERAGPLADPVPQHHAERREAENEERTDRDGSAGEGLKHAPA